jgi:hypothetical protein
MSQHEIPATFTRDQWARIAYACGQTGSRDLLVSIFVQTGVDPVVPEEPVRRRPRFGRSW